MRGLGSPVSSGTRGSPQILATAYCERERNGMGLGKIKNCLSIIVGFVTERDLEHLWCLPEHAIGHRFRSSCLRRAQSTRELEHRVSLVTRDFCDSLHGSSNLTNMISFSLVCGFVTET